MENNQSFQEQLLNTQQSLSETNEDYCRTLQRMNGLSIGKTGRILYAFIFAISLAAALYFGSWLCKHYGSGEMAILVRSMGVFGMSFSAFMAFIAGWSALTGKVRGRFTPGLVVSWTLIVLGYYAVALFYLQFIAPVTIEIMNTGPEGNITMVPILGTHFMLLFFFAVTAVALMCLLRLLSDMKYQNHKKLLEIEYKLCDLLEKTDKK